MRLGDIQGNTQHIMRLSVFFILSVMAAAVSCSPKIYPVQRDTVNISTEVKEVLKDTVIYVTLPQDSLLVFTRDTSSVLRIKTAVSEASVSGGDCIIRSTQTPRIGRKSGFSTRTGWYTGTASYM